MTDRELLEMAAKAVGLPPDGYEGGPGGPMSKGGLVWSGAGHCIDWNPLRNDGDALRLAVKLGICFRYYRNAPPELGLPRECAVAVTKDDQWFAESCMDECAATRRAIVRASAEIGAGMRQADTADSDLPEDNYYKTEAEAQGAAGAEGGL